MKKIYVRYLVLVAVLCLQGMMFISFSNKENKKDKEIFVDVSKEKQDKNINDIFNYFNNIEGVKINSIDNEEKISMDITVNGSKDRIIKFLKDIENYNVTNYNISYVDKKFCLNLTVLGYKNL
ncbi:hypothetical protein J2Z53_001330 [Clostridium moniliforme]|uniref:Uncharacterized protein n=1 Tax=Clostridium moniliforme TaxID=39489 RepID=A0ABS4F0I0_9CLOT|nr:hypothetical protein [Clostridium moniliforme]MBP1889747.1 hypothetical protein [Clostridium moniliforme]